MQDVMSQSKWLVSLHPPFLVAGCALTPMSCPPGFCWFSELNGLTKVSRRTRVTKRRGGVKTNSVAGPLFERHLALTATPLPYEIAPLDTFYKSRHFHLPELFDLAKEDLDALSYVFFLCTGCLSPELCAQGVLLFLGLLWFAASHEVGTPKAGVTATPQ